MKSTTEGPDGRLYCRKYTKTQKLAQYDNVARKEKKTNKQMISNTKNVTNQHTVQSANRKIFLLLKGEVRLYQTPFKRCHGWGRNHVIR